MRLRKVDTVIHMKKALVAEQTLIAVSESSLRVFTEQNEKGV